MVLLTMLIGTKRKSELDIQDTLVTMSHVIYSYPHNPHVTIAKITGKFGGVTNIEESDLQFGFTNRTQEFLSLNPFGWVPTLKTVDGSGVFESLAISRYIARIGSDTEGLLGATPIEQARVDQWTDVVFTELFPHVSALYEFKLGMARTMRLSSTTPVMLSPRCLSFWRNLSPMITYWVTESLWLILCWVSLFFIH